jgi:hypothetical protein
VPAINLSVWQETGFLKHPMECLNCFLVDLKTPKSPFEINWPLLQTTITCHDMNKTYTRCCHGDPQGHLITAHYIALKQDQSKFSWIHRIVDTALLSSCRWLLIENFSTLFNQFYMPMLHSSKVFMYKSRRTVTSPPSFWLTS